MRSLAVNVSKAKLIGAIRSVTKSRGPHRPMRCRHRKSREQDCHLLSRLEVEQLLMKRQRVLKRSSDVRDDERLCGLDVDDADVARLGRRSAARAPALRVQHLNAGDQERDRQVALARHTASRGSGGKRGAGASGLVTALRGVSRRSGSARRAAPHRSPCGALSAARIAASFVSAIEASGLASADAERRVGHGRRRRRRRQRRRERRTGVERGLGAPHWPRAAAAMAASFTAMRASPADLAGCGMRSAHRRARARREPTASCSALGSPCSSAPPAPPCRSPTDGTCRSAGRPAAAHHRSSRRRSQSAGLVSLRRADGGFRALPDWRISNDPHSNQRYRSSGRHKPQQFLRHVCLSS